MSKTKTQDGKLADPLANFIGYHLRRLSVRVMADLARSLHPLDLNPADASVLLTIGANPGVTQSEVGKAIGVLRANMAPLVAQLSSRGWIERQPVDGRSSALRLTSQGESAFAQVTSLIRTHEERMFGALPSAVQAKLIAQLRALWDNQA